MWTKIVNPKTGRKVSIYSTLGNKILQSYTTMIGGDSTQKWSSYVCKGLDEDTCTTQPRSRCKWVDSGNSHFCRKKNSASKKRGNRNIKKLKTKSKSMLIGIKALQGLNLDTSDESDVSVVTIPNLPQKSREKTLSCSLYSSKKDKCNSVSGCKWQNRTNSCVKYRLNSKIKCSRGSLLACKRNPDSQWCDK